MNENKELSMMDAFVALRDLDDDIVSDMIKPKAKRSRSLHEGKSYPISGARDSIAAAKDFLNENDEMQLEVIDPDADALEHIKDRIDYVGQMILRCNRCHANRFIDMEKLIEDPEEEGRYNVEDECPNCKTSDTGYELIGQVGKYEEEKPEEPAAEDTESSDDDSLDNTAEDAADDAEEVSVDNDENDSDELKFDNDELEAEEAAEDDAVDTQQTEDEVVEVEDEQESEPDMMETTSSEDEDDQIETIEDDEDDDDDVKESLYKGPLYEDADKIAEYKKEALMYDKIMDQMANDNVYDYWTAIWKNYSGKVDNLTSSDIVDIKDEFCELYKKYHNEGLVAADADVIKACVLLDKELGLASIENHKMYVEELTNLSNTTISEVLGSFLDADKVGRIEVTNRGSDKKDEKIYDGSYNNLPLNIANANCTSFDINNRTLSCNIDPDENHNRRCLSDILNKFGDDKSDNIHLYDIESSDELFRGNKSDAISKFGKCGFISIDTPAVIRFTICDPSIISSCKEVDKTAEESLVEKLIHENNLSITRLDKVNSNEYWIKESISEKEDLDLIYECFVKSCSKDLISEFKQVTGYTNPLDEAFEAGYNEAASKLLADKDLDKTVDEDVADTFRRVFDKPASWKTQQHWEDELNGECGEISDRRRAHLERKFDQQRDWEARHPEHDTKTPTLSRVEDNAADFAMHEAYMSREQMIDELRKFGKYYNFSRYTDAQIFRMWQRESEKAARAAKAAKKAAEVDLEGTIDTLITDEVEAIAGYEDAENKIRNSSISNKEEILDTLDHIKSEEVEHIDELKDISEENLDEARICESCGGRLNDSGTCPSCDHGEEDLDESLTWICRYKDQEIGKVKADTFDAAVEKMQKEYPDYNYSEYDGCFDVYPEGEEIVEDGSDIEIDDDWSDDDQVNDQEPEVIEYIDLETLEHIVNDEMPRAIKECGRNLKHILSYFMSIIPETGLGEVDEKDLKHLVTTYLEENFDDANVNESFQSFKSRKDLAAAITECKNNSRPYTVRRSVKEGYRYDLILEANESEEIISDEEVAAHEEEIKNYSKDNKEEISKAAGAEVIDKLADASSYTEFVKILNKDRKSKAFLQYLRQHYKTGDDEIETVKASGASTALIECSKLVPTQQNISLDKSLSMIKAGKSGWAVNIINNPATAFNDPTITYAGKYIIDGHHRWSKAYALVGPDAKIKVINFPAIEGVTWKDMLKAAQLAIVAKNPGGDLIHKVGNDNMLADTSGQAAADYYVEHADEKVIEAMKAKGFGDDKEAQSEHVKKNVAAMASTGVVSGAAPRAVMPQTDTAPGSVELLKKAVIDLTEGDNLPAQTDAAQVALTAEEAEVNAKIMRISQDIAQAILDVYGIEADPALIVADILQDLGLISGDIRPEDLEDTALNRATIDMYSSHEAFWLFMDTLARALGADPITLTPEAKIKRAVKALSGPNFSTSAIRQGIESTQFHRLVAQGKVPFVPAGSTPLLVGESLDDESSDIEVNVEKFDSDMNEYFNEAYDDTVLYTTTSGSVNSDGTIILEGLIESEDTSSGITFTLKPESPINESLENEVDKTSKLESLTYEVTNNISEETFQFRFSDE